MTAFKDFTGIALWEALTGAFFLASMALAGWTYGGWMWGAMP